jgi:hypothetical protein
MPGVVVGVVEGGGGGVLGTVVVVETGAGATVVGATMYEDGGCTTMSGFVVVVGVGVFAATKCPTGGGTNTRCG